MHRDEHDGNPEQEVQGQSVAKKRGAKEPSQQCGDCTAVLLQDGVRILEEETGQDALQSIVGHKEQRDLQLQKSMVRGSTPDQVTKSFPPVIINHLTH